MDSLLPTPKKSHYTFNLRDFSRVIQGVLLSVSEKYLNPAKMVRLWFHEMNRVFYDRLIDDPDRKALFEFGKKTVKSAFQMEFNTVFGAYDFDKDGQISDDDIRSLVYCTYLSPKESYGKAYDEISDMGELTTFIDKVLAEFNQLSKKPMVNQRFLFLIGSCHVQICY